MSPGEAESPGPLVEVHPGAWVAPTALLFGKVEVGEGASLWHYAVARAECQHIRIGRMTNVQDHAVIHVGFDVPTEIGEFCSITHRAVVHGCTLGDACLVGPGAVVMDGAEIGAGSIVAPGAVVPEGRVFPPHSILAGVPARPIAERDESHANRINALVYHRNAEAYRRGDHRAWTGPAYQSWRASLD